MNDRQQAIYWPNYQACPVNLANSILKYFDCTPFHAGLADVDEMLRQNPVRNVVLYLCDGLGSALLREHLEPSNFLRCHWIRDYSSVFPPTTTAATTSILTGKEPCEHGWLGWNLYFERENQIVTMFLNLLKDTNQPAAEYSVAETTFPIRVLSEWIEENDSAKGTLLFPFRYTVYEGMEDLHQKIRGLLDQKEKNFIYAYDTEPDGILHRNGCHSPKVRAQIRQIDAQLENLASQLHDTLLIVTADHGHCDVEPVFLSDYPELAELLQRDLSIEPRAVSFAVKDGCHQQFEQRFQQVLGKDFLLLSKEEVKQKKLFGTGSLNPHFDASVGDYLAVAVSNKMILSNHDCLVLKSNHAGFTSAEMQIPLIMVLCE